MARQFRHEVRRRQTGRFVGDMYIPLESGCIFGRFRSKLWDITDYGDSSVFAKVILLTFAIYLPVSSVDNLCKQFGPKSGLTL